MLAIYGEHVLAGDAQDALGDSEHAFAMEAGIGDNRQRFAYQWLKPEGTGQRCGCWPAYVSWSHQLTEHSTYGAFVTAARADYQQHLLLTGIECQAVAEPLLEQCDALRIVRPELIEQ